MPARIVVEGDVKPAEKSLGDLSKTLKAGAIAEGLEKIKSVFDHIVTQVPGFNKSIKDAADNSLALAGAGVKLAGAFGPVGALIGGAVGGTLGVGLAILKTRSEEAAVAGQVLAEAAALQAERFAYQATQAREAYEAVSSLQRLIAGKDNPLNTDASLKRAEAIMALGVPEAKATFALAKRVDDTISAISELESQKATLTDLVAGDPKKLDEATQTLGAYDSEIEKLTGFLGQLRGQQKEAIAPTKALTGAIKDQGEAFNGVIQEFATYTKGGKLFAVDVTGITEDPKDSALYKMLGIGDVDPAELSAAVQADIDEIAATLKPPKIEPFDWEGFFRASQASTQMSMLEESAQALGTSISGALEGAATSGVEAFLDALLAGEPAIKAFGKAFFGQLSSFSAVEGAKLMIMGVVDLFRAGRESLSLNPISASLWAAQGAAEFAQGTLLGGAALVAGKLAGRGAGGGAGGGVGGEGGGASGPVGGTRSPFETAEHTTVINISGVPFGTLSLEEAYVIGGRVEEARRVHRENGGGAYRG